ncbi:MAG: HAD-IIIA family hydrolase [Candidatus Eisenbacteria bacterium]
MTRRAVFLDRDGTLNREIGYIGDPADLVLVTGFGPALLRLAHAGYALVVVSNQSAIGRGVLTAAQVDAVNARLLLFLQAEGVAVDGLFLCPHAPADGCDCRKPAPGLLLQARDALDLDLEGSWLVGDSAHDMAAARAAGVHPLLVLTGWGKRDREAALAGGLAAEDVVAHVGEAAERILAAAAPSAS